MVEFEKYSDEELIRFLRQGEESVADYLMEKYKGLVKNKARFLFLLGGESEDLIQEGMIGLFKAVRDYDESKHASFHTFAGMCISRQMYTAVEASARQKHAPLNSYISLYRTPGEQGKEAENGEEAALVQALYTASEKSPEEVLIDRESMEQLYGEMEKVLSPLEKQVLHLYLNGLGYAEIAKVLGREEKSTDNALQRMKHKLRRLMKEKTER